MVNDGKHGQFFMIYSDFLTSLNHEHETILHWNRIIALTVYN